MVCGGTVDRPSPRLEVPQDLTRWIPKFSQSMSCSCPSQNFDQTGWKSKSADIVIPETASRKNM